MNVRHANLKMIKSFPGGKDALAVAMGMTIHAFDNRLYNRKGQDFTADEELQIQSFSGTTFFADAVASLSGGVFVELPDVSDIGNDELLEKWNALYAKVGEFSGKFSRAISDDVVDQRERQDLSAAGEGVNKLVQELLALTFRIYCKQHEKED